MSVATGQTQQTGQKKWGKIGADWQDVSTAYCLGRSYVGMRAEDVLAAACYATTQLDGGSVAAVDLIAVGSVGVRALHAAAVEPSLFSSVKLSRTLVSWANVIQRRVTVNQYVNVVKIDRFGLGLYIAENTTRTNRKWHDDVVAATSYIGPMATAKKTDDDDAAD